MTKQDNWIIQTVKELNLPKDYAIFGSGLLDVLGLRAAHDIDIVVTKELFDLLEKQECWNKFLYDDGCSGLRHEHQDIEVFYESKMSYCSAREIEQKIQNTETIEGVKFVNLDDILEWKRAMGREKDKVDVELIEKYKEVKL